MIRKLLAAAVAAASLFAGSSATAAQVVKMESVEFEASGIAYPYGSFKAPDAGMQAFVTIHYSGGSLDPGSYFHATRDVTYSYWDEGLGAINGNEYPFEQICSVSNGCIQIIKPGYAIAKLMTPRNWFLKECTPATPDYCSELYRPATGYFEGVFTSDGTGDRINLSVVVRDFTAVPEPATWAMMIAGFGLAGSALRRRRQTAYC